MTATADGRVAPARRAAADELTVLARAGGLAGAFPRLAGLLAEAAEEELARAGRLLARLDPADVLAAHPATPTVRIAVTGHGTLAPLVPALTGELARHGLLAVPRLGDFDSWVFELSDPESALYRHGPDLTLAVLDPAIVFDEVGLPWGPDDVARVLEEKLDLVERLVAGFTAASRGTLVLNTLPLPRRYAAQLVDHRSRARLGAVWRAANARLLGLAEREPAVVVLDLDPLLAEGVRAVDPRLAAYAKAYLSGELLAGYAREVGHLARAVAGRTSKCLVLDLDGTVWGGILGDDGIEGIEVADSFRGEAFRAFQRVVRQIGSQGVLVAAVSKNEAANVRAALADHAGMTLRADDFVRVIANWEPKHDNLRELAAGLNLGVDSFVFVDDSAYERGLVRETLPGVAVVAVDEDPAGHVDALLRDGWFDTRELTAEDRARPGAYRAEAARRDFTASASSLEDYLRGLGVEVWLGPVRDDEVPRVSQLTLRTNQFHTTTRRLQQAELRAYADTPGNAVLAIRSRDRFGENGLVGAVFLRRQAGAAPEADTVVLENFLLSCRVFSRGIEQAVLAAVLRHAREAGAAAVIARYRPTAKNVVVADLYPRHGFAGPGGTGDGDGDGDQSFRHDLVTLPAVPGHLTLHDTVALDARTAPGDLPGGRSPDHPAQGEQDVVDDRDQVPVGDG
ncbi:HAD-IIIC family phosphatase [Parafrankia sp. FMc2]|uniref:HAD-IIIC family phosphatase n=1 Tax=Parafrankia sp. FMc2 TaxID=3233196 RepID=UPI0034D616A7